MATQVAIDRKDREAHGAGHGIGHGIGHGVATWAVATVDRLGRALVWIFDRIQSTRGSEGKRKQMKLVECLALGNRRQLLLVVCDNQRYLVGVGADSVGGILAMEAGAGSAESAGYGPATPPRSIRRTAKGPVLVRHLGRQIASEHEAGSGLWP